MHMNIAVLGILLTIFSGVSAKNGPNHSDMDKYHQAKYDFSYGVRDETTGDVKNHWEQRMGDVVRGKIRMRTNLCFPNSPSNYASSFTGAYSLLEADGSIRVVEYYADVQTGFRAIVRRFGRNYYTNASDKKHRGYFPATSYVNINRYKLAK